MACAFRRQHLFDNRRDQYIGHLSLGVNPKLGQRVHDADQADDDRFGEELGDHVAVVGTQCLPQADLVGAFRHGHQHDVHDTDAADHQAN